jgi:hypothetical protein
VRAAAGRCSWYKFSKVLTIVALYSDMLGARLLTFPEFLPGLEETVESLLHEKARLTLELQAREGGGRGVGGVEVQRLELEMAVCRAEYESLRERLELSIILSQVS